MIGAKSEVQKTRIVFTSAFLLLIALASRVQSAQAQTALQDTRKESQEYEPTRLALRQRDGLHKAALLSNGYFVRSENSLPWNCAESLQQVVHESRTVVVGLVMYSRAELLEGGNDIETHFSVRVEQGHQG